MPERKEYRSAVRSRKLIRQAFLELLREKPYEKITVTDIVKRADINRSTFYAHYPDVQGLVDEIQDEVVERSISLVAEMSYDSIFEDPLPFLQILTEPVKENYELYKLLGRNDSALRMMEKIKDVFIKKILNASNIPEELRRSKAFEIRIHLFIGGIINTYQQWMQDKLDCSIEEIADEITKIITSSAEALLNPGNDQ